MSYQIDHTDKPNYGSITVEDQTVNIEKSIGFVGKNYTGYAKVLAENFLHLLEHFAAATAPSNPVTGQLWYDTNINSSPSQPQLKVYDGTNWVAAGNVKKAPSAPSANQTVIGDLWADTANQQLYLWSGANWVLVGPQFSEGTLTGPKVETIYDTLNAPQLIISFYVGNQIVIIISKTSFTPKVAIAGFAEIKKGANISTSDSGFKLWGTAQKADSLVVSNEVVAASNFLRTDKPGTISGQVSIRNNLGLVVGSDLATSLSVDTSGAAILYNKTEGSSIFIRTNQAGQPSDVLSISGTNVGVNKTNPIEALDVVGKIHTNDQLIVTGTSNALDLTTGSIKTAGGVSITKSLVVGQGATIVGTITSNSLLPSTTNNYDIGSSNNRYKSIFTKEIFADTFFGNFSGQVSGSVTGSAARLASSTAISLTGDVTSNIINFNGQQPNGIATFSTTITSDLISAKAAEESVGDAAQLLVNVPTQGLRKITKSNFLANAGVLPIGAIMPFAGTAVPNGFLFCDGSEQLISNFSLLFGVIGYTYKAQGLLVGAATFAVPDLRGRFPLGPDNMNNGTLVPEKTNPTNYISSINATADRVTDVQADNVGLGNGSEQTTLSVDQLPDHKHDLRGTTSTGAKGLQYYAFRNSSDPITDVDVVSHTTNGPDSAGNGQYLTNSGGVDSGTLGNPLNKMNPYLTINYIIFTGTYN
jgi:microcystin-dependent protein